VAIACALAVVAVVGLVDLWPRGSGPEPPGQRLDTLAAEVVAVDAEGCRSQGLPGQEAPTCLRVEARIDEGPEAGRVAAFDLIDVDVGVGDGIRVSRSDLPPGTEIGGVEVDRYAFADFERGAPLLWLAVAFAALVLVTARWKGLRALVGLAISLTVVVAFVVPAILDGRPPVPVAFVAALAIMLATIPLAHGVGPRSLAAIVGTAAALVLTLTLAAAMTSATHLTGFASEDATLVRASGADVSLRGVLIAGVVIAALGVLDDLTVSQASTVMALRTANPGLGARELFTRGMAVGHDHVVATVNTLVLAYAGAALPTLLVFGIADTAFLDAATSETVAAEVVATLVGSIGLIVAAPVTTAIAAYLATQVAPADLSAEGAHDHG
jgi:uncharacterized membrane protein